MALALFCLLAVAGIGLTVLLIRRVTRDGLRGALIMLAVLLAIPGIPVLGIASARLANNWRLDAFAAQLFEFPLPPGATVQSRHAAVGVLTGNGNHCDFVVRQELATELSIDAVRAHYHALELEPAITGGASGGPPALEIAPRIAGGYVVTAVDAPYEFILDDRCH